MARSKSCRAAQAGGFVPGNPAYKLTMQHLLVGMDASDAISQGLVAAGMPEIRQRNAQCDSPMVLGRGSILVWPKVSKTAIIRLQFVVVIPTRFASAPRVRQSTDSSA
jgi:hypothetical protein